MILKRVTTISLLFLLCLTSFVSKVGQMAPELQLLQAVKGEGFTIAEQKGKNYVVLHFWGTQCPPCDEAIAFLQKNYAEYSSKGVKFMAIGSDDPISISKHNRLDSYPCTVASDDIVKTADSYLRAFDRIPTEVLIGKDGRIMWIGHPFYLGDVLKEVFADEYDIKAAIELDEFNCAMAEAQQKRDYKTSLRLINRRLKKHPDSIPLIIAKCNLLANQLSTPEKAIVELNKAIKDNPKVFDLYDTKINILNGLGGRNREIHQTYSEIAKNFNDQPMLLLHLGEKLMQQPVGTYHLSSVYHLVRSAYNSEKIVEKEDKGRAAAVLARCYYYVGMLEKALRYQKQAYSSLRGTKQEERAVTDLEYYNSALVVAREIQNIESNEESE